MRKSNIGIYCTKKIYEQQQFEVRINEKKKIYTNHI